MVHFWCVKILSWLLLNFTNINVEVHIIFMLSFYSIEISHSIALCEPFPLYILLLYQIIVHSISLFCYISFFTFILIRIYLQWSSYPISIGHPSVIFTQMKFLPLLFNSFGTVSCCTIFWICFCGNFFLVIITSLICNS